MGTVKQFDKIGSTLFGKTRRAVLGLLFGHTNESFYVRQIVRVTGAGTGAVQRELLALADAGLLERTVRGQQVYYQANRACPVFEEIRSLILKTAGVADVIRGALAPLADRIAAAFVYGSFARGAERQGSDVDLLIVGDVAFREAVVALGPAQTALSREINPSVYSVAEWRRKIRSSHHFLTAVLTGPRIMILGDERELARLAAQRLAGGTHFKPGGDRKPARRG